jgi:hypothetical protein
LENSEGVKAIDFCRAKSKTDTFLVLQSFLQTNQHIQEKDYSLESDHEFCAEKVLSDKRFHCSLKEEE